MEVPFGFCHCGCGEKTKICKKSDPRDGALSGQPYRYISQHQHRTTPFPYEVRECGYNTPCWIWLWAKFGNGYGSITKSGVSRCAHIIYYERKFGLVPEGRELHHLCEMKACVNPDHTQPLTRIEHVRLTFAMKTHCRRGHEKTPDNWKFDGFHMRCIPCRKARAKVRSRKMRLLKGLKPRDFMKARIESEGLLPVTL